MSPPPKVPPAPRPAATVDALATLRGMGFEELVASASLQAAGWGDGWLGWVGRLGCTCSGGSSQQGNPPSEVLTQFANETKPFSKGKDHLPTTSFRGRAVKLRGCKWLTTRVRAVFVPNRSGCGMPFQMALKNGL